MTTSPAVRVRAYLDARAAKIYLGDDVIAWQVDEHHEEHTLTISDLHALLDELLTPDRSTLNP